MIKLTLYKCILHLNKPWNKIVTQTHFAKFLPTPQNSIDSEIVDVFGCFIPTFYTLLPFPLISLVFIWKCTRNPQVGLQPLFQPSPALCHKKVLDAFLRGQRLSFRDAHLVSFLHSRCLSIFGRHLRRVGSSGAKLTAFCSPSLPGTGIHFYCRRQRLKSSSHRNTAHFHRRQKITA